MAFPVDQAALGLLIFSTPGWLGWLWTSTGVHGFIDLSVPLRYESQLHQNLGRAFAGRSCRPTLPISASSTVMLSLLPCAFSYYVAEDYCVNSRVFSSGSDNAYPGVLDF